MIGGQYVARAWVEFLQSFCLNWYKADCKQHSRPNARHPVLSIAGTIEERRSHGKRPHHDGCERDQRCCEQPCAKGSSQFRKHGLTEGTASWLSSYSRHPPQSLGP